MLIDATHKIFEQEYEDVTVPNYGTWWPVDREYVNLDIVYTPHDFGALLLTIHFEPPGLPSVTSGVYWGVLGLVERAHPSPLHVPSIVWSNKAPYPPTCSLKFVLHLCPRQAGYLSVMDSLEEPTPTPSNIIAPPTRIIFYIRNNLGTDLYLPPSVIKMFLIDLRLQNSFLTQEVLFND
jgi:hypothetical protein